MGNSLITDEQDGWVTAQMAALQQLGVLRAHQCRSGHITPQCQRTGLDRSRSGIYMIGRKSKENGAWTSNQTIRKQASTGSRFIARRAADRLHAGTFNEPETLWWGGRRMA